MTKDEIWAVIRELSDIRAQYSAFDEEERKRYRACSVAIAALRNELEERNEEGSEERK